MVNNLKGRNAFSAFSVSLTGPRIAQRLISWSAFGLDTVLSSGDSINTLDTVINWIGEKTGNFVFMYKMSFHEVLNKLDYE